MAEISSGFPIPACVEFVCGTVGDATDMNQVEINADAALSDFKTKVVATSTQTDLVCGYVANWAELQDGYAAPIKQHEYFPKKNCDFYVDDKDITVFGTNINPAYIMSKDFAFEVNSWDTQYNLLMEVYRRQYEEVSNIAGGGVYAVEQWAESNFAETLGLTAWTMNQLIRVEYHDGTNVLVLVDEANNVVDIPLNLRLCSADGNIYINALNDLVALGYTPPTVGTTRTDFIRVFVINMRGNISGNPGPPNVDPEAYFVTNNIPTQPFDYAGVRYLNFSMGKTPCVM
jgi:hypothetical protein